MAAAFDSTMNYPMVGRHLENLPSGPAEGTAIKDDLRESVWLRFIHSDVGETCSALAFNYTQPNLPGKRHESVFESFYRLRLTQSVEVGPDIEVSVHPMYATRAYTTTLLSARMRIIF